MHKAQKSDVEPVKTGGHTTKDLLALEKIFNQVSGLVAVLVQDALVLFMVNLARDDELQAMFFGGLDNLVRVVCLVRQKDLGL